MCLNFSLFFFRHFHGLKSLPRVANLLLLRIGGVWVPGTSESERMAASLSTSSATRSPNEKKKKEGRERTSFIFLIFLKSKRTSFYLVREVSFLFFNPGTHCTGDINSNACLLDSTFQQRFKDNLGRQSYKSGKKKIFSPQNFINDECILCRWVYKSSTDVRTGLNDPSA